MPCQEGILRAQYQPLLDVSSNFAFAACSHLTIVDLGLERCHFRQLGTLVWSREEGWRRRWLLEVPISERRLCFGSHAAHEPYNHMSDGPNFPLCIERVKYRRAARRLSEAIELLIVLALDGGARPVAAAAKWSGGEEAAVEGPDLGEPVNAGGRLARSS